MAVIFAAFAALLVGIFLWTLFYWYERKTDSSDDIPALPFTPGNAAYVCLATLYGVCACCAGLLADAARNCLPKADAPIQGSGAAMPVLLIHGLYHNRSAWFFLRRPLRRAGFARIHYMEYPSKNMTIPVLGDRLEQQVAGLERLYPGVKPLLVGHSLGGLIIQQWLRLPGAEQRISGILTLGTPFRGSKMAAFAIGRLGQSLHPVEPFFAEPAAGQPPTSIPRVAIASRADCDVLPLRSLVPPQNGWTFLLSPAVSHLGMLSAPKVTRMAAWELHKMTLPAQQ